MTSKKQRVFIGSTVLLTAIIIVLAWLMQREPHYENVREISPRRGTIKIFITSTGKVQPQNRLEIKPPINGRVDRILVREGQRVRAGDILIWMSSNERAALIDAARSQGKQSLKYWEKAYKQIPLIAPINGMLIVRSVETGQTVNSTTPVLVLSDRLIVKAEIDETDIGRVKVGQTSIISLDAYPDVKVNGRVSHISYESKIISNVTMYEVDIIPETVPEVFRSGMSANISIIMEVKENILLLPVEAVIREKGENYVMIRPGNGEEAIKKIVKLGISDEKEVEIVSGLDVSDRVIMKIRRYELRNNSSRSPFRPAKKNRKDK